MTGRGLTLRILWTMSQARREQLRFTMLPHMAGKFDVAKFLRTGVVIERRAYPVPDTPAFRKAQEDLAREQAALRERLRDGK